MGRMHWYKRDPDAALAGMAELTMAERGAYNSIIDLLYSRAGNVPDDDALVARMIGCHWREWRALKARLIERGKIRLEGGKITANRVQETLKEAADFSQEQRRRAAKRWHEAKKTRENNEPSVPPGTANTTTTTSTPTSTISKEPDGSLGAHNGAARHERRTKPRTRLPTDWQPSEQGWAYASERGCGAAEVDRFKNHHAGKGSLMADWDAAWRTWCGNAQRFGAAPYRGGNGGGGKGVVAALRILRAADGDG